MNTPILDIDSITKSFKDGNKVATVLNSVSFSVNRGEFISIMGPSGCGKSTLLNIMGLLDTPDSGSYLIDGVSASALNHEQRAAMRCARLGFVFQSFNLIEDLTLQENVELPLKYRGDTKADRVGRAQECLTTVGMGDHADKFPNQISGGQQQRVSIARALANKAGILLVDEPTGNLDTANGDAIMDTLINLNTRGTTICLVTHDKRYAAQCDRTVELKDGHIICENPRVRSEDAKTCNLEGA